MGILQRAIETFDANTARVGKYYVGEKEPLAPIGHMIAKAQIEITIDQNGNFVRADAVDAENEKTIIPVTEDSAGRSGKKAYMRPHLLCDKLPYLTAEENFFIPQLEEWAASYVSNPKLDAVLHYVKGRTIREDLTSDGLKVKDDAFVRWNVIGLGEDSGPCWTDHKLFRLYQDYLIETQTGDETVCMVTGKSERRAKQHAKGVVSLYGNAKLISANDETGFTFRGRFVEETQAATVSFTASQKAHNALRWIIANQGVAFGKRYFICWNPQGIRIQNPTQRFLGNNAVVVSKPSQYKEQLFATLGSCKKELQLKGNEVAVIATLDASTKGRLSLIYYNEMSIVLFLEKLCKWDERCCWWYWNYGVQAPAISALVDCAYGTQRIEQDKPKLETDDNVMKKEMQTLLSCRLGENTFPENIETSLIERAGRPQAFDLIIWRKILFSACAAIHITIYQKRGEDVMSWDLNTPDRSFQYGRLLAAMDQAEADYYYLSGEKERQTNALKMMSAFRRRPFAVYEQVNLQLIHAYLPRLKPWQKNRYQRVKAEIVSIISTFPQEELNKPLSELYLLGYDLQRRAFYSTENTKEDTENE